jgi:site-specific recombinase XerD
VREFVPPSFNTLTESGREDSAPARQPVAVRFDQIVAKSHDIVYGELHRGILKEQTVMIVKGKGGKSRILPIGQYCTHYLELYLEKARKYMLKGKRQDPGFLFLSQRGRPFNKSTINATVIKSVVRNAKLKKPISVYSFRYTVATHLLAHKVDIMYI